jgi:hypothetical protein
MKSNKVISTLLLLSFVFFIALSCNKKIASKLPTVTTDAVTNITSNAADCGGNVTNDGGESLLSRGICWSRTSNPTIFINDSVTKLATNVGAYYSMMSNLAPQTKYYVRAYASNSLGVAYGNQISFSTLPSTK